MRTSRSDSLKVVCFNVMLFVVLLVALEGIYKVVRPNAEFSVRTFPGYHTNIIIPSRFWAKPDPDIGWVVRASKDAPVNSEGFRATSDFDKLALKGPIKRVMVLGDSFTFGSYIKYSETLPFLLQEKLGLGYEVYNFGIPGWGIDQMYLAYMKYVEKIDPDFVLLVYIDDDVLRVFEAFRNFEGLNKPSFKVVEGHLTSRDGDKPGFWEWVGKRSLIVNKYYKYIFRNRECKNIVETIFTELSHETRRRGQELIVLRYPTKPEVLAKPAVVARIPKYFDFEDFLKDNDIMYLDPIKEMSAAYNDKASFYLKEDDHPTKEGNDFVSSFILRNSNVQQSDLERQPLAR